MTGRRLAELCVIAFVALLTVAPLARGDAERPEDGADCGLLAVDENGAARCADTEQIHGPARTQDPSCRFDVDAVFYAGSDWVRLAQGLAKAPLPCGSYAVSVAALANPKTGLRPLQDDIVRGLGIEPLAEVHLDLTTGWPRWAHQRGGDAAAWELAGREFRKAMKAAGYQPGERWSVNELDYTTIRDVVAPPTAPNPTLSRDLIQALLKGLYEGDATTTADDQQGVVLLGIPFRQQNIPDVAAYKRDLQSFLADDEFWLAVDRYASGFGIEVYPDTRLWAVEGSNRGERRRRLEEYLFHVNELAESGPDNTARNVLARKSFPMANAIWRARGGDPFGFASGAGNTVVDDVTMRQFVSEQVHAIRHYAGSHTQGAPGPRIAFAWLPCNRSSAEQANCPAQTAPFIAGLDAIAARMGEAIGDAYRNGGASPVGACHAPGSAVDWCSGAVVPGAAFTDAWRDFDWE